MNFVRRPATRSGPEPGYMKERRRIQAENDKKTAHLRALRLAKEAAEQEAAAALPPKKTRASRRAAPTEVAVAVAVAIDPVDGPVTEEV